MTLSMITKAQSICNANGNVIIYSNYDGGILKINIDQNIPNIKIGVCSYEAMDIEVTGTYSANVTEVVYAGFNNSPNINCSPNVPTTTFHVANTTTTSISFVPAVTYNNPNGYSSLICNYSCNSSSSQGGCNTPDQVVGYFMTRFGGTFYSHFTQYGCYISSNVKNISNGGNCCIQPPITTDIQKNNQANNNIVSPNPANNLLSITFNKLTVEHTVTLINELGQKAYSIKSYQNTEEINVKDLDRGMYFLLIDDGINLQYQKIILE